jgi:hypothetical protein
MNHAHETISLPLNKSLVIHIGLLEIYNSDVSPLTLKIEQKKFLLDIGSNSAYSSPPWGYPIGWLKNGDENLKWPVTC